MKVPLLPQAEPYGYVTTHTVTGRQFFYRHPAPPYLDTAKECIAVYATPQQAQPAPADCWCETCRPITLTDMRMVLCPTCGNKRCPRATDHRNACTNSNEPGQVGSSYANCAPAAPAVSNLVESHLIRTAPAVQPRKFTDDQLLEIYWKASWNSDGKAPMNTWERDYSSTIHKGLRAVANACYGIAAPAVPDPAMGNPISPMKPLSGDVLYALWASENGLEDCKLFKLNDFTKAARFFEQAHGIAAPGNDK